MTDIAKKPRRITPLDRRNYGATNTSKKPNRFYPPAPELPPNPTMKRVNGKWKCDCGRTYKIAECAFCRDGHNKSRVSA